MTALYVILDKERGYGCARCTSDLESVTAWFLGRKVSRYIAIKCDSAGERVVTLAGAKGDVKVIETILKHA
jgi:hypothetical protein